MLIYGAYGYTGTLIVEEALNRGLRPVVAGRDIDKVNALAERYGLMGLAFELTDTAALDRALQNRRLVMHCAGPFAATFQPMAAACLRHRIHYLDITGEIEVFEGLAALDPQAREAGVMLLPGVGFDVVPTDCLAAHLKTRMPAATHLTLAIRGGGGFSRGTRRTMLEGLGYSGAVRRDGRIVRVPAAWKTREVDFGDGRIRTTVTIPWGDVASAWHSTGIPNIETYAAMPQSQIRWLKLSRYFGWLLRRASVHARLRRRIADAAPGPNAALRASTQSFAWGEVRDDKGQVMRSRLRCINGYEFTAKSAVSAAARVIKGDAKAGFQTPSRAFGAEFVHTLGASIEDLPLARP